MSRKTVRTRINLAVELRWLAEFEKMFKVDSENFGVKIQRAFMDLSVLSMKKKVLTWLIAASHKSFITPFVHYAFHQFWNTYIWILSFWTIFEKKPSYWSHQDIWVNWKLRNFRWTCLLHLYLSIHLLFFIYLFLLPPFSFSSFFYCFFSFYCNFFTNRLKWSVNSAVLGDGLLDAVSSAAVAISRVIHSENKLVSMVPIIYIMYVWIDLLGGVNIFTFNLNVGGFLMAVLIPYFSKSLQFERLTTRLVYSFL